MAVNPALTTPENAALSGVTTVRRYLSPIPETIIATAQVNMGSITFPVAALTVDNTSADWDDVAAGMVVYIGTTSGARDIGVYRVRKAGNSTTLYIGELASQDAGQLPIAIRTSGIVNNAHITVIQDWRISTVLPLINPATGAIYEDYDLSVGVNNTTPAPLVNITVNNRRNHFATLIADGETFAIEAIAAPTSWPTSDGETFTYQWFPPAEFTDVSGDDTATLTANVPPGNYVVPLTVTGSGSGATKRIVIVQIHDESTNPPLLISEMPRSDNRDRTGRKMSFDLYGNRLERLIPGAACIYFEMSTWTAAWVDSEGVLDEALDDSDDEIDVDDGALFAEDDILLIESEQMLVISIASNTLTVTRGYNGTLAASHADESAIYIYSPSSDVPTATRQMFGWVLRHDKGTGAGLRQATIDLVSPTYILATLNSTSQIVQAVSSPATWQQVKPALSTATFLAWYMLKWRTANVLLLFNFVPYSVDPVGQRLPSWTIGKGTILQQLQLLATERGNIGCDSEGAIYFLRHPSLIPSADRGSIVVRDSVNPSIYSEASNPREMSNRVQQVRGEGLSWNGSAALPTPYFSDAPKVPGQGTSQIKLPAQVVTGQDELEQLTGDRYAQSNNPYPIVTYKIERNRDVIEPAHMQFVQTAIPANLSGDGIAYNEKIVPLSVGKTHNADGTSDLTTTGEGETHGIKGDFVAVPVANDNLYMPDYTPAPIDPLPDLSMGDFGSIVVPAAVPSPTGATVSPGKGAIWVSADGSAIKRTLDITVEPPVVDDVTPASAFFTAFVMVVHDKSKNFSRGAYALGNNGTDSKVAYTADIYADVVEWTVGTTLVGVFTQIESAGRESLSGGVAVYSPDTTGGIPDYDFDFTLNNQGFAAYVNAFAVSYGTYVPGEGWAQGFPGRIIAARNLTGYTFNRAVYYLSEILDDYGNVANYLREYAANPTLGTPIVAADITESDVYEFDSFSSNQGLMFEIGTNDSMPNVRLTRIQLYSGSGSSYTSVAWSDDYGATFTPQNIGDPAGVDAAFCLSRFGTVALAAVDAAVEKATSFGGTFGAVTGGGTTGTYPLAARITWKKIGNPSASNNSTSPDFYMASAAPISTESLWKVIAGTKTAVTPSVTGTKALGATSNSIGTYASNRICFIGDVSGTRYIFSSHSSGASWVNTAVAGATSVRAQRFSPSGLIWIAAAPSDVKYSADGGVSWDSRTAIGGSLFAEIFG